MLVLEKIADYAADTQLLAWAGQGESLTFAQLDARSNAFAAWLLERFGDSRAPVLLYGGKEAGFLPCLFGALKSGRPYVPVDASSPPARVADIAADVDPCAVVDFSGRIAGDVPADAVSQGRRAADPPRNAAETAEERFAAVPVLGRETLGPILRAPPRRAVARELWVRGADTAYILFTSGSTGRPKGVPITANNLAAFHRGVLPWLSGPLPHPYRGANPNGIILDQVSYSFDVSGCALYAGLARGMTLLAVDAGMTAEPSLLFERLRDSCLTVWVSTPSFAELCVRSRAFGQALLPELRTLLFCGEVLTHKLCDALADRFSAARIVNTYGPTEATVLVSAVNVTRAMRESPLPIPIGLPVGDTTLRLDDPRDVAGEERGELLIVGESVGPGYLGRPELTAQRFFTDEESGRRGYRTGDLCARHGELFYYRGRIDNQIKLGGHRVEPEDIERNLVKLRGIRRAAVLPVWEEENGDARVRELAAFIALEEDDGLTPLARTVSLKKRAAGLLPGYMIPRRFIAVEEFPLTSSGKLDRAALGRLL